MPERTIITIDGPNSAGKTSTAKALAERLKFAYLDTGAIFRTIALYVVENGLTAVVDYCERRYDNELLCSKLSPIETLMRVEYEDRTQHMFLGDRDVSAFIRSPEISEMASRIGVFAYVRDFALRTERDIAKNQSIVVEGRDTGSAVFPEANLKIFLTAEPLARARRRMAQRPGEFISEKDALRATNLRDYRDSNREIAPLTAAPGAHLVDNSYLTLKETVRDILKLYYEKRPDLPEWYEKKFRSNTCHVLDLSPKLRLMLRNTCAPYGVPQPTRNYTAELLIGPNWRVITTWALHDGGNVEAVKKNAIVIAEGFIKEQAESYETALEVLKWM